MKMKNIALAAALMIASTSAFAAKWECTDTRDGFYFQFEDSEARKTMHPKYGQIMEVRAEEGLLIITEQQMQDTYRCFKKDGFAAGVEV